MTLHLEVINRSLFTSSTGVMIAPKYLMTKKFPVQMDGSSTDKVQIKELLL